MSTREPTNPLASLVPSPGRILGALREAVRPSSLLAALKTLGWLGPLTILIWLQAENASLYSSPAISITLRPVSTDAQRIAVITEPASRSLSLRVTGKRLVASQVENTLRNDRQLDLTIDGSFPPGRQQRSVSELLASHPLFRDSRVRVESVEPKEVTLVVDQIEEQEVAVRPPAGLSTLDSAAFEPARVKIRAPSEVFRRLRAEGRELVAEAEISMLPQLRQAGSHTIAVNVNCSARDANLTIVPATVTAALEVRLPDDSFKVPSVPVWLYGPPDKLNPIAIRLEPAFVTNVVLAGPAEQIQRIRDASFKLRGRVDFTENELRNMQVGQTGSATVVFDLPPGVRVKSADRDGKVDYRIEAR